jgi:TruD family tRNA pseudouridine synthase
MLKTEFGCSGTSFYENIGITFPLLTGRIKCDVYKELEDFIVIETHPEGRKCSTDGVSSKIRRLESPFIHATLVKRGISTFEACDIFSRENGIKYSDITTCGLKDTLGLTSQIICIKNNPNLEVKHTNFSKFFLKNFRQSDEKLDVGSHEGNSFIIRLRDVHTPRYKAEDILSKFKTLTKGGLPNFYGPQRFGIRQDNHLLGKMLIKGDYESFVRQFITFSRNEDDKTMEIRNLLSENFGDWDICLKTISRNTEFTDEKVLIEKLKEGKSLFDSVKAMKFSTFFVHSYSSFLFNMALSKILSEEYRNVNLEKIGTFTTFDAFNKAAYSEIMENENVTLREFASCGFEVKGHPRNSLFYPKDFNFRFLDNDILLSFTLGKGEYASLMLEFLIDSDIRKLC